MKQPGYVYILTNPSFKEDWVKIGKSSRPVDVRSKELDNTAVPLPFEIFATLKTEKYDKAEKLIHRYIERFTNLRIRDNREFFNVKPEDALAIFRDVAMVLDDAEIDEVYKRSVNGEEDEKSTSSRTRRTPERAEQYTWLISANTKYFNLEGCIQKYGVVYWSQYFHYQTGDTIYVYNSSPDSCIRYKFIVEDHDLQFSAEMEQEKEFHADFKDFENTKLHNCFVKLKFVDRTSSDRLSLIHLMDHGLGMAPRGAVHLTGELLDYIEKNF